MAVQVASPSSATKYRYDVFLSFRGEDTRKCFTVNLYDYLRKKGINAFIDDRKLGKGERIASSLLKAIEKSMISIIVFSKNYATSTWCLDELAHIIRCKEDKNQVVMPIFYKVDPMDVQYQRNSFEEAMVALEERFRNDAGKDRNSFGEESAAHEDRLRKNLEKLKKWRSALFEAASLSSAWLFQDGCEFRFIERIAEYVYGMLPPKPYHNIEHMVGLEPRIEEVISLLNKSDKDVCMLGIHGTGGIGKTTLAKAIYNSIFYHFEGACFLLDVNEASKKFQGIVHLQQKLLSEILGERIMRFGSAGEGISRIKHRLSRKRVLLLLDDVDEIEHLEQLAGGCDWFGCGSKVIITTRNKQLLIAHNVKSTYELKELNNRESLELFCRHAFLMSLPPKGYQQMSRHVISYAKGLPLALKLIGANLANKNKKEWRSILEQYDRIPERTIHEVLKVSYDCLQDGAKITFLDIACFFKDEMSDSLDEILQACDSGARFYIEVLIDKSLIAISDSDRHLRMHDLIKQMGKEIVRKEAPSNPSKRSRLWNHKDVLKILHENSGSSNIEGILFDPPQQEEVKWSGIAFEKMNNLRILIVRKARFSTGPKYLPNSLRWLEWEGYPSAKLPPNFSPNKLVLFKLPCNPFRLEEPFKRFECLTYMNFSQCEFITEVPDMSQFQSLRKLSFSDCRNLIKVHDSVGYLSKVVELDVRRCVNLTSFPHEINMPSLKDIALSNCKSLDYFPNIVGKMDALTDIWLEDTSIRELPPSIENLAGLECLSLSNCKSLRELPNSLFTLQNLSWLDLEGIQPDIRKSLKKLMQESQPVISCTSVLNLKNCCLLDEDIHLALNRFRNLIELNLSGNDFVSLPECLKECGLLWKLYIKNCKRLRDIPELPSYLADIDAENCISLTTESLGHLWSQAKKKSSEARIILPATTFPDWLHNWREGGKISFLVRRNFPDVVFAFQLGKANTSGTQHFHVSASINGRVMLKEYLSFDILQDHLYLFKLRTAFGGEDWRWIQRFMVLEWNDVEIQVDSSEMPDIGVVKCGVYVYEQKTIMEDIHFKSPSPIMFSLNNAPTTSLKPRAIASPTHERPYKKFLRKLKVADKGKLDKTKKASRRNKQQFIHSRYKSRRMVFPMGKNV